MIATNVNTGKDRASQFYQEMMKKGSRVVKQQRKLCRNNLRSPAAVKYLGTLLKLILLQACRRYIVESLPENARSYQRWYKRFRTPPLDQSDYSNLLHHGLSVVGNIGAKLHLAEYPKTAKLPT